MVQPKRNWWLDFVRSPAGAAAMAFKGQYAQSPEVPPQTVGYAGGLPSKKEYLRLLRLVLDAYVADGQMDKATASQYYDRLAYDAEINGVTSESYLMDVIGPIYEKGGGPLAAELEGATEVLRGNLYQGTGGHWFNKQGDVVSDEVAQWMLAKAGQQPPTGETPEPGSVSGIDYQAEAARTQASRMGRQAWEQGQQGALAKLQGPQDWINKWMTQYARKPSFDLPKLWGDMTPAERGQYLANNPFGVWSEGMLRSGYTDIGQYRGALEGARNIMDEYGQVSVPEGDFPVAAGGAAPAGGPTGNEAGGYVSPNAPRRRGPPVPDWITRYVPSLKGGVGLFKQGVGEGETGALPTPSPYQLAQLNPSQLGQLQGYQEWAAPKMLTRVQKRQGIQPMSWDDIIAQGQRMTPRGIPGVRSYGALRRT